MLSKRLLAPTADAGFDPEANLTLTDSFAAGRSNISSSEVNLNANNVVFACDLTGLSTSLSDGLIYEQGASAVGAYIGFDSSSGDSTGDFIARCADGGTRWPSNTGYLRVDENATVFPEGDGTLVVEFSSSGSGDWSVRAWWNGEEMTGTTQTGAVSSDNWAGSNEGAYLAVASAVCSSENPNPVTYATASALRYYEDQVVT